MVTPMPRTARACLCVGLLLAVPAAAQPFYQLVEEALDLPVDFRPRTMAWNDYDSDGRPDLFIAEGGTPEWGRIALLHNEGNGRFANRSAQVQGDIPVQQKGGGAVFGDHDNDGDHDLYLPVGVYRGDLAAANPLLDNDRGTLSALAATGDLADVLPTDNAIWLDYDRDGLLDLYTGNLSCFDDEPWVHNRLYRNTGSGFADVTRAAGLETVMQEGCGGSNGGMAAADFDDDGWPDIYVGVFADPNRLFVNQGDGTFVEHTVDSGIGRTGNSLSFGDYDLDGFLDVVTVGDGSGGLYRNQGHFGHWLRVELVGTESNRSAIGARLRATAGDLSQTREVLGGRGYEQDELVAHFGLGRHSWVDTMEIRWPSGRTEVVEDIPADQQVRIIEGQGRFHPVRAALWLQAPPDSFAASQPARVRALVRPAPFEEGARVTRVTADLSPLGGSAAVALAPAGDGTYRLNASLVAAGPHGLKPLSVLIEQETSLGPYWTSLSQTVLLAPAADLPIATESGRWSAQLVGITTLGPAATGQVLEGATALGLEGRGFTVEFTPPAPVVPAGYRALRFALHPGDATVGGRLVLLAVFSFADDTRLSLSLADTALVDHLSRPGAQRVAGGRVAAGCPWRRRAHLLDPAVGQPAGQLLPGRHAPSECRAADTGAYRGLRAAYRYRTTGPGAGAELPQPLQRRHRHRLCLAAAPAGGTGGLQRVRPAGGDPDPGSAPGRPLCRALGGPPKWRRGVGLGAVSLPAAGREPGRIT